MPEATQTILTAEWPDVENRTYGSFTISFSMRKGHTRTGAIWANSASEQNYHFLKESRLGIY